MAATVSGQSARHLGLNPDREKRARPAASVVECAASSAAAVGRRDSSTGLLWAACPRAYVAEDADMRLRTAGGPTPNRRQPRGRECLSDAPSTRKTVTRHLGVARTGFTVRAADVSIQ